MSEHERGTARAKLLDAAIDVIRRQGYHATSVDDLCRAAGVTKGAFFHHFASKRELAVAAADHWSRTTGNLFERATYHDAPTPTERVLGYLDLRSDLISGPAESFTCLVGTMAQETFASEPEIRDACADSILGHASTLEADLDAALSPEAVADGVTAADLARHMQAVIQGAFILAKATHDPAAATDSIEHLRRYVTHLLQPA
ncbi:MAG: TetR family transcriptional regulator [Acidimicrobiaceae bacterium]|nr:TetR family transcriptional regulator [Acidimicrobiaceae bacterium]